MLRSAIVRRSLPSFAEIMTISSFLAARIVEGADTDAFQCTTGRSEGEEERIGIGEGDCERKGLTGEGDLEVRGPRTTESVSSPHAAARRSMREAARRAILGIL